MSIHHENRENRAEESLIFSFVCFKSKHLLYCFRGKDQNLGYLNDAFSIRKFKGRLGIEPSTNLTRSGNLKHNTENELFT